MFSVHITHQAEQDKAIQMEPWFGDAEPSVTVTQSKVIGMSWDVEQRVDASSLSSFSAHPGSSVPVWKCGLCLNSIVGSQTLSKVPGAAVVHGSCCSPREPRRDGAVFSRSYGRTERPEK